MGAETGGGYFTVGLPSKEDLIKQYGECMSGIDEYLANNPYTDPEILMVESVPAELFEYVK